MKRFFLFSAAVAFAFTANASWYWPFESSDDDQPRLSELMSDATSLIDEAAELAADGKIQEAVAKYREALTELANVEANNPERAATTEFSSLRNKRAYVSAAIDTLLLSEARANAKAVSITDTTELEKRYLQKHGKMPVTAKPVSAIDVKPVSMSAVREYPSKEKNQRESTIEVLSARLSRNPENRKLRMSLIGEFIKGERFESAQREIGVLLKANMTDASALNLKAVCEAAQGDLKAAENTLDLAIQSHPRDYNGYYNMANLKLQSAGNKNIAKRYYETGRALGGPKDAELEAAVAE